MGAPYRIRALQQRPRLKLVEQQYEHKAIPEWKLPTKSEWHEQRQECGERPALRRRLYVVPIPGGRKRPVIRAWQTLRICHEELHDYFNGHPQNIGVLLGEPSDWVVDVDLDTPEAVELGSRFLVPTLNSGRESAPARTGGTARTELAPRGGKTLTA
jgi:hypothetical protein